MLPLLGWPDGAAAAIQDARAMSCPDIWSRNRPRFLSSGMTPSTNTLTPSGTSGGRTRESIDEPSRTTSAAHPQFRQASQRSSNVQAALPPSGANASSLPRICCASVVGGADIRNDVCEDPHIRSCAPMSPQSLRQGRTRAPSPHPAIAASMKINSADRAAISSVSRSADAR